MRKVILFFFISLSTIGFAQNRYLVVFKDKIEVGFNPITYFDTAAIKSFELQGLPKYDWYDLPVNSNYIDEVSDQVDSVRFDLRWFNGLVVYGTSHQINEVEQFYFVKEIIKLGDSGVILSNDTKNTINLKLEKQLPVFDWQLETMGNSYFKSKNIDGSGIRVCVLDVGFPDVDTYLITQHIFKGNYIEGWDFIRGKPLRFKGNKHGQQVLSFIAGKLDTHQVGLAPKIELLLARTELMLTEKKFEEEVWIKAVEWAHQKGARLVNSSLGYNSKKHNHNELDGKTALISRAGNLAARKGLLVINAAGNEGDNNWKRIVVPADADSVLAVGAIDDKIGVRAAFSSYGPSKDLRIKPNVCALGSVYILNGKKLKLINGTSFAAPLVTGFAACVLQIDPTLKPYDLMDKIQKVSSLYPYYDYSHGYGVPQASKLFNEVVFEDTASVVLLKSPNYLKKEYYYFKYRKKSDESTQIFYHIQSKEGYLKSYHVIKFDTKNSISPNISFDELEKGDIIRVWHRGTYFEKIIK
tara:strand:+ start:1295 stop:2869 length:1575 start_codon:yes stop_codon:yes gene_type:complete